MNQFPYLYPHSLSEAERLNEEELWQDNRDAEVSHTQLTEMFRHSDPAALMDEAEQAQLAELDDTVTVYRGVTTINSDNLLACRGHWTMRLPTGLPVALMRTAQCIKRRSIKNISLHCLMAVMNRRSCWTPST